MIRTSELSRGSSLLRTICEVVFGETGRINPARAWREGVAELLEIVSPMERTELNIIERGLSANQLATHRVAEDRDSTDPTLVGKSLSFRAASGGI